MSVTRRKNETASGLWSISVGDYGCKVNARERERGGIVVLDADRHRILEPTGIRVRDASGRIDKQSAKMVEELARDRAAKLRTDRAAEKKLQQLRRSLEPTKLTVDGAFALFHDADKGGMPVSKSARKHHIGAKLFWTGELGASTPWNQVTPADVKAAIDPLKKAGKIQTADKLLRNLRTVHKWLVEQKDIEGLKDPVRKFDFNALWQGYKERRPAHSPAEARRIIAVRNEVDLRFGLMVVLDDDSGARSAALRRALRSHLDERLDKSPTAEQAPYGWLNLPGMKGQRRNLVLLTLRQRIELTRALWKRWNGVRWVPGFLSELERRYQESGEDYYLIPGGIMPRSRVILKSAQISERTPVYWLHEAEVKAGIERVEWRAWHGFRRGVAQYVYKETDLDTVTDAMDWSGSETPAEIYLEEQRLDRRARAREAHERKGE